MATRVKKITPLPDSVTLPATVTSRQLGSGPIDSGGDAPDPAEALAVPAPETSYEERVREKAYELWTMEGRPDGQHERHWDMAEQLLRQHQG